jgi:acyl transferase domain-containing protein
MIRNAWETQITFKDCQVILRDNTDEDDIQIGIVKNEQKTVISLTPEEITTLIDQLEDYIDREGPMPKKL